MYYRFLNSNIFRFESKNRKNGNDMCNLSQGIKEQAHAEGLAEAVIKLNKKGYSAEQISDLLDMAVEKVQKIIDNQA